MKKIYFVFLAGTLFIASSFSGPVFYKGPGPDCFYENYKLKQDTKGRCYYINSKGKKTYINKKYCEACGKLA